MPKLKSDVEAFYMNQLSFSVRPAAMELFRYVMMEHLLHIRQGNIPKDLTEKFDLSDAQWLKVSNAVILTKISQVSLAKHLKPDVLVFMKKTLIACLDIKSNDLDVIAETIREDAPVLSRWVLSFKKFQRLNS